MGGRHQLSTPRLVLEPVTPEHADEAWPHLDDARMWEFFPHLRPGSLQDLRRLYERWAAGYQESDGAQVWENWLCRRRDNGRLAGGAQSTLLPLSRTAYLAYGIYVEQQRRGFAQEAMTAVIAHSREAHQIQTFFVEVHVRNVASFRLAEALGFERIESPRVADQGDEPNGDEFLYRLVL
ncbi:MAG: GNAT family N-acetyltransferase [Candidatus Eremiobacteraeota bacterium]|nr:GNAT family N-acetyltransferase [Candidatus Eremiobacteraeota bacterium]